MKSSVVEDFAFSARSNPDAAGSALPYATAAAFRTALRAKFTEIAVNDPPILRDRAVTPVRLRSRCFSADDADRWMLKGAGTLPARLPVARHSKDIDLYYAERAAEPNAAVAALARVADRDVGDHFRFELTKTTPLQETAKGRWVHPLTWAAFTQPSMWTSWSTPLTGEPDMCHL